MKNINGRTVSDDLSVIRAAISASTGAKKAFLRRKQVDVEQAITDYKTSIVSGTVAPLGLAKGRKAVKAVKGVKAKPSVVAVKAVRAKPATKDEHEYYYGLYDEASIAAEKKALNDKYFGDICPYCGIDTVRSIDHYFPRAVFPEFSISLQNMIMSCDFCNSTYKLTHWGNGSNKLVVNPVFDTLPTQVFLVATCVYRNQSLIPNFSIVPNLPMSPLLERHFVRMNLNDRYIAKATLIETKEIKSKLDSCRTYNQKVKGLNSFVSDKITVNGVNTWRNAFYLSVQPLIPQIASGGL